MDTVYLCRIFYMYDRVYAYNASENNARISLHISNQLKIPNKLDNPLILHAELDILCDYGLQERNFLS